ncbi:hypothetical protein [Sulfurimonas hydrogeniphila]|uniref:hypothetical protein n=1 Tax=Sulfurimonas TaxID=202746 RepID=UPI00125F8AD3|nr:hypothetical protein [Sulfurimonas hydrogeniphila]
MKKTVTAQTFTPIYDVVEDRIRFVINYEDIHNRIDFMITRNFILDLIPTAQEFLEKHFSLDTPIRTIQENKNSAVSARTETDGVNLELYRTKEELLMEVNFTLQAKNEIKISLASQNILATAVVDAFVMQEIFHVLKSAIPNINWGIAENF